MNSIIPPTTDPQDETCRSCATLTQTKRYCALGRCYCGHPECPAFASYIDLHAVPLADAPPAARPRSSWDDREEPTWIDSM